MNEEKDIIESFDYEKSKKHESAKQINELLTKEGDYSFNVNEWGSCQYSGALAMYKAYFKLREKFDRDHVLEYLKYEYGYDISFSGIHDDKQAIDMFFKLYAISRRWNFDLNNYYENSEYDKLNNYDKKLIGTIRRAQSADDLFFIGRYACSDLWNTAPRVAESYFISFEAKNLPDCENITGLERGPVGNICAQSVNILTGICCALLVDYEIIKNINSFKSFDT